MFLTNMFFFREISTVSVIEYKLVAPEIIMDLTKPFDRENHAILIANIQYYGVRELASSLTMSLFSSFYHLNYFLRRST